MNRGEEICLAFDELGVKLADKQAEKFLEYYELLAEWNRVMNLTAITEFDEVVLKHFIDSVAVAQVMDMKNVCSLIDVGTGAGFPGIPLKLVFPHLRVTLLDSLQKRVQFLERVIKKLGCEETEAVHGRAEDLGRADAYREKYDVSVSRAVANLSTLAEYCVPFVKVGGMFISYKSKEAEKEIEEAKKAIGMLGCELEECRKISLPGKSIIERSFVLIRKKKELEAKYPRRAGIPARKPLS